MNQVVALIETKILTSKKVPEGLNNDQYYKLVKK
jgi:hypothetical protein